MAFLNALSQTFTAGFLADFWKLVIGDWFGFIVNYGWRVVVFTVVLKLVLSPLDFFNRKKSYDNKRLMRRMKPEMDRLEKQYANDQKELMMRKRALQKKYGYGMGMTCVTSILTMIIFISVWNGFREVSTEMQISAYNDMLSHHRTLVQEIYKDPSSVTELQAGAEKSVVALYWDSFVSDYQNGKVKGAGEKSFATRKAALKEELAAANPDLEKDALDALVDTTALANLNAWAAECHQATLGYAFDLSMTTAAYKELFTESWADYVANYKLLGDFKTNKDALVATLKAENAEITDAEIELAVDAKVDEWATTYYLAQYKLVFGEELTAVDKANAVFCVYNGLLNVYDSNDALARQLTAVIDYHISDDMVAFYDSEVKEDWLWIKNIWRADTWNKPIMTHKEYQSMTSATVNSAEYNMVMSGVTKKYNDTWNGYLIMIVLVVGLNFLNQWLTMKLQKESGEAQMSGAGGSMKIMLFMMPLMMAVFAFSMASAFTIYMTTNALMTLLITGVTTLILTAREKRFEKLEAAGVIIKTRAEKRAERKAGGVTRTKTPRANTARPSYDRRNLKK